MEYSRQSQSNRHQDGEDPDFSIADGLSHVRRCLFKPPKDDCDTARSKGGNEYIEELARASGGQPERFAKPHLTLIRK